LGCRPRQPVAAGELLKAEARSAWIKEKGLLAFTFIQPKMQYQEVDPLLQSPVTFDAAYAAKTIIKADSIVIPVASIEHLIIMKRQKGRAQDQSDIEALEKIRRLRGGKS